MRKVIISTGGTGGHIFPALSVIEEIKRRFPQCCILFVGGRYGPEKSLVTRAGIDFEALPVKGILGKGLEAVVSFFFLSQSLIKAFFLLRRFRPDLVLGFGGYAGFCMARVACLLGIPTAIHEQNSVPGSSNRILAGKVDKVFLTFPGSNFGGKEEIITGNPVRRDIAALFDEQQPAADSIRSLLVLGGSQGAAAINEAVIRALPDFRSKGIMLWHQTGEKHFAAVRAAYDEHYPQARVSPFIEDMSEAYRFADLVLCRAGATTIAELTLAGKPAILVPYPYAAHDHQMKNAKMVEESGAALVLQQSYFEQVRLVEVVDNLASVPGKLNSMSVAARSLAYPAAAQKIVSELESFLRGKNGKHEDIVE